MHLDRLIDIAKQAGMSLRDTETQEAEELFMFAKILRNAVLDDAKEVCRQIVRETNTALTWEGCAEIQEALEKEKCETDYPHISR